MRTLTLRRTAVAALAAALALGAPAFAKDGKETNKGKHNGPKPKTHPTAPAPRTPGPDNPNCIGSPGAILTINAGGGSGFYALPDQPARGIVVFAHGYGHDAADWSKHLTDTARRDHVVAVAMDYGDSATTGWRVQEGAVYSVAAAQYFNVMCPKATKIVMYGVSMGGNTSGLAVAAKAKRTNGAPLFDYWFDIEGATNVTETYLEARGLAQTGNAFAKGAVEDIEKEMGGPIEDYTDAYLNATVVNRADDIKATNPKLGVVMIHDVDDGLVGYNQSPEMYTRLRALGIAVDFWTVLTRGDKSESGTTLDGYVTNNVPGPVPVASLMPFAGHANETSDTHILGVAGFERLAALFLNHETPSCRTGVIDGATGHDGANPVTVAAPCLLTNS